MNTKTITKIFSLGIIATFLVSCGGGNIRETGSSFPTSSKPSKTETPKYSEADYELDYSYFKKNNLPIPDSFKGRSSAFLIPGNETLKEYGYDFFKKYDEGKALNFYKDLSVKGYGDNSNYWRWKVTFGTSDFKNTVASNLVSVYQANPNVVLTLTDGSWQSRAVTKAVVGNVLKVEVGARGRSGIIAYLVITTNQNKFLVAKEYNIRKLFAPKNRPLYGAHGGQGSYGSAPFRTGLTLLPSAYCAIENSGDSVTIYGGGNGHGAGMSQYAAADLTANYNQSYKQVLSRYYPNTDIVDMYSMSGVTDDIRIGISSSNGGLNHSRAVVTSDGKIKLVGSGFAIDVPSNQVVEATSLGGNQLNIKVDGKQRVKTVNPVVLTTSDTYITLNGIRKAHTSNPSYRGSIELKSTNGSVRIINELFMEDYLRQVLPSEMPKSFGVESLKVQAVAARTYVLSDYLKNKYKSEGFHVKDTVESQVYNNQLENDEANEAIDATKGQVMIYNGKPIDAKYFSTSSGFIEAANYIW